ncbi:biotin/lipoate A/B protein ligase family protein [Dysgonomonas sp. ZJ709]|uniref:lipoate--protein ligase family protein n=1 Tax=Dysgonomonas sp. ZJ709 TaxID=2709797 RepID=UPI0013EDD248|nr:biotin/lipoate A/B protein ligase family protein [Dysgonomonas sp. ZJ709]
MLCINNTNVDPYFNIAAEEYLLKNFSEDIFMLWQNEPSVILGKHQNVPAEINLDFVQENNIKVVRRFSGGGTVFHDMGNLNLTFIETNSNINFDKFTQEIVDLLSELGIEAKSDARRAINIDGLKVSGSAQCVHKGRAMFHATLLFSSDLSSLVATLEGDPEEAENKDKASKKVYVKSVKSPVTNISKYVPNSFDINDFKKFILDYFRKKNEENKIYAFDKKDIINIQNLKEAKYLTPEWNFNSYSLK